ncbi:MAG TPA: radical SAM protein [Chloroflexi bacterium]|nr:radical SAM protein [Chloroflexota bacterium]
MIAFGPVPSRRLGRSLGINNIPPKICPYSCIYCQLGRTIKMQIERRPFYEPEQIVQAVEDKVAQARDAGETIDYLTFVPDGEPTLDVNLGREIALLRPLGIKIAVISNGSMIWREDVREDLMEADWVSLKVDAAQEEVWRKIDRPHGKLRLGTILGGALELTRALEGELATETMLVAGVNDGEACLRDTADFLAQLHANRDGAVTYLSIPTRPPAEAWATAPTEQAINRAYQIFSQRLERVEYLIGYEGNAFAFTGDVEDDLLSITSVHPMREDAVDAFLARARPEQEREARWTLVRDLIAQEKIVETVYGERKFYVRKIN